MSNCTIQWIDSETGKPTPDTNVAIRRVRVVAHETPCDAALSGWIHHQESRWYPICADHFARYIAEELCNEFWQSEELEKMEVTK